VQSASREILNSLELAELSRDGEGKGEGGLSVLFSIKNDVNFFVRTTGRGEKKRGKEKRRKRSCHYRFVYREISGASGKGKRKWKNRERGGEVVP